MSRTIRRKDYVPTWVTHTYRGPLGYWNRVALEGKELQLALAKHHGDHGFVTTSGSGHGAGKWFRQNEQQTYRAQCRIEIAKYLHNYEHEVMILANPKLTYWD